jgi:hypothetical protein
MRNSTFNIYKIGIILFLLLLAFIPKAKASENEVVKKEKIKYYLQIDGKYSKGDHATIRPGFKIGATLYDTFYSYVGSFFKNDNPTGHINDMDYIVGVGFKKKVHDFVPFLELNYSDKKISYDLGVGNIIKDKYEPYIKFDQLLDKNKSDAIAGFTYLINEKLSASAEYTVYSENIKKYADISVSYEF